jgi:hypothetical protein
MFRAGEWEQGMRIEQTSRASSQGRTRKSASAGAGGAFSLAPAPELAKAQTSGAAPAIQGIEALVALQAVDGRAGGREAAVKRGEQMLDALDELKLAVLEGRPGEAALLRLKAALAEQKGETASGSNLATVLDEIELRAEVELAKRQRSR